MTERIDVRHVINDALDEWFEANDFSPYDPDNVKELARHLRDALVERFPELIDGTQRHD